MQDVGMQSIQAIEKGLVVWPYDAGNVIMCLLLQTALRAIVSSLAHDDSLVQEVRQAFEELEHGHTGSVKNATLLQVCPKAQLCLQLFLHTKLSIQPQAGNLFFFSDFLRRPSACRLSSAKSKASTWKYSGLLPYRRPMEA